MAKGFTQFHKLRVVNPNKPEDKLVLTFVERDVMEDTARELLLRGYVIDPEPTYTLFRNKHDAIESVEFWFGKREAA